MTFEVEQVHRFKIFLFNTLSLHEWQELASGRDIQTNDINAIMKVLRIKELG